MRSQRTELISAAALVAVSLAISSANASTIDITIDTSVLNGVPAILAFDFIDGGPPDNSVTLSALTSDGAPGSTSTSGNVTGTGPWTFSDAGGPFFSELLATFNPMGTSLSFSLSTTDHPPALGSLPDAFSIVVLDASGTVPLITTDDPTGANAVFLFNLGQGFGGVSVSKTDQEGFAVNATPGVSLPEPNSAALLLAAVSSCLALRRSRKPATARSAA